MHEYSPVPYFAAQDRSEKSAKFDFLTVVSGYFHSLCRLPIEVLLLKISAPGYLMDFVNHMWNTAACNIFLVEFLNNHENISQKLQAKD